MGQTSSAGNDLFAPGDVEIVPVFYRPLSHFISRLPNSLLPDQHLHISAPLACVQTPSPDYNDPPISLRPLHFDNSSKVSVLAYEPYPFQGTDTKDDQPVCHMSKPRIPFWRTKKGIALIVLLSNIIVIGIVLGIVFGTRIDRRHHESSMPDDSSPLGQNSQGSPSPDNQDNSMSPFPTVTSSSSTSLISISPTTSYCSNLLCRTHAGYPLLA